MSKHRRESCQSELELATADGERAYKRAKSQRTAKQRFEEKPPKNNEPETDRTSTENKERAYVAASRRTDRSIEARMASARRASEIHEERTGKALIVSEAIILNDEMYEELDKSMPRRYQRLSLNTAPMPEAKLPERYGLHSRPEPTAKNCSLEWNTDIDKLFAQCFPGAEASMPQHSSEVLPLSPQLQTQAQAQAQEQALWWPSNREPVSDSGLYQQQPQQQPQLEMFLADGLVSESSMQTSKLPPSASPPASFPALGLESGFPPLALDAQGLLGTVVLDPGKLLTPPEDA